MRTYPVFSTDFYIHRNFYWVNCKYCELNLRYPHTRHFKYLTSLIHITIKNNIRSFFFRQFFLFDNIPSIIETSIQLPSKLSMWSLIYCCFSRCVTVLWLFWLPDAAHRELLYSMQMNANFAQNKEQWGRDYIIIWISLKGMKAHWNIW